MKVTIWNKFNNNSNKFEHNHISLEYDENIKEPKAMSDVQKNSWKNCKWESIEGDLINGKLTHSKG